MTASRRHGHATTTDIYLVRWSIDALANLEAVLEYIDAFDPAAAVRLAERMFAATDSLEQFPRRGRALGDGGYEISTVWPYLIRYTIADEVVTVSRIRHGARQAD